MEMMLRLPNNYVEIEEEEMMYLDGGWSWNTLKSNLVGAWNNSLGFRKALGAAGFTLTWLKCVGTMTYSAAVVKFGSAIVSAGLALGGFYAVCFGIVGTMAAVTYLGSTRVFY